MGIAETSMVFVISDVGVLHRENFVQEQAVRTILPPKLIVSLALESYHDRKFLLAVATEGEILPNVQGQ